MPRRRAKVGRLERVYLDVFAAWWVARAMWRLSHGRLPWQGKRPRPAR